MIGLLPIFRRKHWQVMQRDWSLFAINGYKYRLILSSEIAEEDYDEMKKGYRLRDVLRKEFINRLNEPITIEEECNLSNLAYLISIGTL